MDYQFGQSFVNGDPYLSEIQVGTMYPTDLNTFEPPFVGYSSESVNTQYLPETSGNGQDVMYWTGQDCMNWARNVCASNGIDSSYVNINYFGSLTGEMLVNFTEYNFYNIDSNCGYTLYQEFRRLMEQRGIAPSSPVPMNVESAPEADYQPPEDYQLTDLSMELPVDIETFAQFLDDSNPDIGLEQLDNFQDLSFQGDFTSIKSEYSDDEETIYPYESHLHEVPSSPLSDTSSELPLSPPSSPEPSSFVVGSDVLEKIKTTSRKRVRGPKNWEYMMRLLSDTTYNPSVIRWENEEQWTFRIVKPAMVAHIWGQRSNKPKLTYDNFARGLRYHYTTGALKAVSERQLVYKCGPKAQKYLREMKQFGR